MLKSGEGIINQTATDDLMTMCEFEIALRNLLASQGRIRDIIEQYSDEGEPGVGLRLLDSTLCQVERLVAVVAAFQNMLAIGSGAVSSPKRLRA